MSESTNSNAGSGSTSEAGSQEGKGMVSYETHALLLSQRKKDQEKLKEAEEKLKSLEAKELSENERKLAEQGNYKKLLETREKEINDLKKKVDELNTTVKVYNEVEIKTMKLNAFNKAIGGELMNDDCYGIVRFDEIALGADGKPDEMSVKAYASKFVEANKFLIKTSGRGLPTNAPGKAGSMSIEEWTELAQRDPKAARLRIKDVK